jgi:ABC-type multidrug transport system fused ATPase/permease subunit
MTKLRIFSALLNRSDRRKGILVIFLVTAGSLLDFVSLASFLPLIYVIINPGQIESNDYINTVYKALNFSSPSTLIITFTLCVLVFTLIKNLAAHRIAQAKARYIFTIGSQISSLALSRYMKASYLKFTQIDYTQELNRIAIVPITFANNIISPLATLLSEGLVFVLLIACLIFYDIQTFTVVIIVLTPFSLLYFMRRNSLRKISQDLMTKYPLSLKYALQVVEGLFEIRAFNKEGYFKKRFNELSRSLSLTFAKDHTTQTGASRITEVIAALIICSLIIFAVVTSQDYRHTILLLGVYAGASFRMIPSLNRMIGAGIQIRKHEHLFQELTDLVDTEPLVNKPTGTKANFATTLELVDLSYQYPNGGRVIDHVSLLIRKGEKIALMGKSGTGKTTLLLILLQFLTEYKGKVLLDGIEIQPANRKAWQNILGYVPQNPLLLDGTIVENIAFGIPPEEIDIKKIDQLIHDLDLDEMVKALPEGADTPIGEKGIKLSGGQRQRLSIARALYANAEILLLDEVTNQLDMNTEREILMLFEKESMSNKTILMVTHQQDLTLKFDRTIRFENGILFDSSLEKSSR